MCAVRVFASFSAKIESESPLQPVSYRLTITATTIATINFESEESARDWMESWEEQDYKNLNWSDDEATEMVLENDSKPILVAYCEMKPGKQPHSNEDT